MTIRVLFNNGSSRSFTNVLGITKSEKPESYLIKRIDVTGTYRIHRILKNVVSRVIITTPEMCVDVETDYREVVT